jgi:Xaa-Pro dipeptidase
MDDITTKREPRKISAEDINPRYNWGRHLPVLGTMGVDFEERVDYRRLQRYRLARAHAALEKSDLGALLLFDDNNIRYVTSTKIGEWARDIRSVWNLIFGRMDTSLLVFVSAAFQDTLY